MGTINIRCAGCQQALQVNQQSQPTRVKCPHCQTVLLVPGTSDASAQPPTTATATDNPFGDLPTTPQGAPASFPASSPVATPSPVAAPPSTSSRKSQKTGKGLSTGMIVILIVLTLVGAPILCCGIVGFIASSRMSGTPVAVMTEGLEAIPIPGSMPELGRPYMTLDGDVAVYNVQLSGEGPGGRTQLRIYMPPGNPEPHSVGCVLVAPAGTPLLHGASIDDDSYHDETLPYALAGMVVVHYSIDGAVPDSVNMADDAAYTQALSKAYPAFRQSGGGIVNGRNALHYALSKILIVDPDRIYSAGHSSAGTLALNLAANEPLIHRCVAYAPAYDCEKRMAEAINDPVTQMLLPGIKSFIEWYSPMNKVDQYRCPIMICHAADDDNVPIADFQRFRKALSDRGIQGLNPVESAGGGHYQPMVDSWIPLAIQWLKEDTKE